MSGSSRGDQGRRLTNPYATKNVSPGLFTKPLEYFDDFEGREEKKPSDSDQNGGRHVDGSTEHKTDQTDQETSAMEDQSTHSSSPMSVSLPFWKRLPSRTVTFGPAEILTVSEACRHASLYATKSIRTTGILSHRFTLPETNQVSLVLKDPLAKLSEPTTSVATTASKKSRRISFGSTPSAPSTTTANKRRPSLGMARNRTTPLLSRTIRPSSTVKTPLVRGILPRTPSSVQFRTPASRKRPLKTPRKLTPEESLAAALADGLWIVADPQHVPVESLAIGDVVTAMGMVQEGPLNNKQLHFVQARILRQDNGANLRLHQEVLQLRRQHLLTTYFSKEAPTTNSLLLGCGPPPYNLPVAEKVGAST